MTIYSANQYFEKDFRMEAEIVNVRPQLGFIQRVVPVLLPVLLVSVGYIDPGKWVANIEGGARFGYDFVAITLLFSFAAVLCQYVAARISVATGRNLAQVFVPLSFKYQTLWLLFS